MNRIDATFHALGTRGQPAFIPFLTAGDPDLETTENIIVQGQRAGADIIELGFPFSDPVADGPVIQASYTRVLQKGQRTEDVFRLVESVRAHSKLPIVAMISYSLVFRMGFERFLERALQAGFDGATIPDLPIEEAQELHHRARERDFRLICFVTPATTEARRAMVVTHAQGFIYYISVRGITGERNGLPEDLMRNLKQLKGLTDVPVAVGFGISNPDQARAVGKVADGVIVGSAIVKRIHDAVTQGQDPVRVATGFIETMAKAARGAH